MTNEELNEILEKHEKWLHDEEGGERADFSNTDLRNVDFSKRNLWMASFKGADLTNANLTKITGRSVDFSGANLTGANFEGALLARANFLYADLEGANLRNAFLYATNFALANFENANLENVLISDTTNFKDAGFKHTQYVPYIPLACPDTGSFIGWKKARIVGNDEDEDETWWCIVKLEICEDAKRSSATTNKCRASKVKVLGFETLLGQSLPDDTYVESEFDPTFVYKVNTIIEIENFDEDRWNECASGIHFFINRQEAVNY